jgi:osmotically-inducible protein OsmY
MKARADNHIRAEVRVALARHEPLLDFGVQLIDVSEAKGVVTLRGNVRNVAHKGIAGQRAREAEGVTEVRNLLVDDGELLRRVGTAFGEHDDTRGIVHRPIETFLGVVTLRGPAPSAAFAEAAPRLAAQVPGVRLVLDQLHADIEAAEPMVEAVFGRKAVLAGQEIGRVEEVLVDPLATRVEGVVIRQGRLPSLWAVLPPSACGRSDDVHLYLDLSQRELSELPVGLHARPHSAGGALDVGRRTPIVSVWKRRVGRVAGVRFNRDTGAISHVLMRTGGFFSVTAWVPIAGLSITRERGIVSSLSADDMRRVVEAGEPRSADKVVRDAESRLLFKRWREEPAGIISVGYRAGRLLLQGQMRDPVDARTVEGLTQGVRGVIGVENRISVKPAPSAELPAGSSADVSREERLAA